jgi:hypothetical protein
MQSVPEQKARSSVLYYIVYIPCQICSVDIIVLFLFLRRTFYLRTLYVYTGLNILWHIDPLLGNYRETNN